MTDQLHPDDQQWTPPGGELSLDDLFPNPELPPQGGAPVTQVPTQTGQPEHFLKASTGTVYKTPEDAVRGIEEKDRTIERQKAQLAELQSKLQPQTAQPPQPDFAEQAFDKLASAAQKGDKRAYIQALAEVQMATLSQFAPALTGVYEQQAITSLESEVKDFRSWLSGPEYSKTLEQFPMLSNAIQTAKSDPRAAGQLNEYYKLAYRAYAGDPERIHETQTQVAQNSAAPASTPTRPTLQTSTPTPVGSSLPTNVGAPYTREQIMTDRAKRQEFLKRYQQERGQSLDRTFGELGL
jgi:hypothetical protein